MHIVLVHIHIKPEAREAFVKATLENARQSILEPGIQRFDFIQQGDNPDQYILLEAYNSPDDQQKHRETPHYQVWKQAVESMMSEPRVGIKYHNLYPPDEAWKK